MRKIHSLLAAACLLAASCNKEEIQSETDKAGMYHITVAVTGSSPKGSVHIYVNLVLQKELWMVEKLDSQQAGKKV